MADSVVLAIDQGTTSSTCIIVEIKQQKASIIAKHSVEFKQHYPKPQLVEHHPDEIWASCISACKKALEIAHNEHRIQVKQITAIGISNQRETVVAVQRSTKQAIGNALVWQDKRSTSICEALRQQGLEPSIRAKTGLIVDPYFSASKIKWWLDHSDEIAALHRKDDIVFLTIDSFLLMKLTGNETLATEASNASRTMLYDINKGAWDSELQEIFGLGKKNCLPEVKDSSGIFGKTKGLGFLPDGIPISGILGDQQAALAGQACFKQGQGKCTYGTGAFLLVQQEKKLKIDPKSRILQTVAWQLKGQMNYAAEGSCFIAGAAVQFFRDQLGFFAKSADCEGKAAKQWVSPHLYFVPALSGLGAPYWQPQAKGAFLGLTRDTSQEQLIRACLEGVAFSVNDLISCMKNELGLEFTQLRVDGGASANDLLMQIQADISNVLVERSTVVESTAFGAALFAAMGVKAFSNLKDLSTVFLLQRSFKASSSSKERSNRLEYWTKAVNASLSFV